ncbi:hypothetical protein [Hufsiella ginkgonis]|uniref:DUF3667 domain-containing protein n=1 Tax=Hufsiella ginkgonis TaxID=2695274 RepID=A0A7K1XWS7_9SPHI|nr:hypothetical protein [Hufsiella ginkgonis]MXV15435.1 hypothetical protein [Hufsiella ginkgonis]
MTEEHVTIKAVHSAHGCKNCGTDFTGSFCNSCGQRASHRLTVAHLMHDLGHIFLHADKAIFPFAWSVTIQPGVKALEFVEGKRKMFNPVQYMILSVGLVMLLMSKTDFYQSMYAMRKDISAQGSNKFQEKQLAIDNFTKEHTNIISLIMVPAFALFCWWQFKKRGYNYAENVMVIVFAMCQINTLNILILLVAMLLHLQAPAIIMLTFLLTMACFSITFMQFFQVKWYTAAAKSVLTYLLSMVVQIVVMAIAVFIYMLAF